MQETISVTTTSVIKAGAALTFAYPAGRNAASYLDVPGNVLVLPSGVELFQGGGNFAVRHGVNSISVTYGNGPNSPAGVVSLRLPLAGALGGPAVLTQTQYDAITAPDAGTVYLIPEV